MSRCPRLKVHALSFVEVISSLLSPSFSFTLKNHRYVVQKAYCTLSVCVCLCVRACVCVCVCVCAVRQYAYINVCVLHSMFSILVYLYIYRQYYVFFIYYSKD